MNEPEVGAENGGEQEPRDEKVRAAKGAMWQFFVLLRELLQTVEEPPRRTKHKRLPLHDMLFIMITKVFFGLSSKDVCLFLELLHPDLQPPPFIPHPNSVTNYMRPAWIEEILEALVGTSSKPLAPYSGVLYAIDSTPMLAPGYYMSKDRKTGKLFETRDWIRLHMICDVLTGIVTAARADSKHVAEQVYFQVLVEETMALGFHVEAVSADKNYCTDDHVQWADKRGIKTYLTVKRSAVRRRGNKDKDLAWNENYDRNKSDDPEVKLKFHKRNMIETVNSSVKQKYDEELFNKSPTGRDSEALCKAICRNLIVLINYSRDRGFTPVFHKQSY